METENAYITIGGQYAKPLGYENCVGGTAIITGVMKALATVVIIASPDTNMIGKSVDVHKQDAHLQKSQPDPHYYAFADHTHEKICYSKHQDYLEFTLNKLRRSAKVQLIGVAKPLHYITDKASDLTKGRDYEFICLDRPTHSYAIHWIKEYARVFPKAAEKIIHPKKKSPTKHSLTDDLRQQLKKQQGD